MNWRTKKAAVVAAATLAVVGGGVGGALAAGGTDNPGAEKQAFLTDAANRLGTTADKLEAALKAAAIDRVDAAVADGRITADQGARLKERIQNGLPLFPGVLGGRAMAPLPVVRSVVSSAADYLGLSIRQLFAQLHSGKSLADLANARNKSLDGLEAAMLAGAKSQLDDAVKAGRITATQEQKVLDALKARLPDIVQKKGLLGILAAARR